MCVHTYTYTCINMYAYTSIHNYAYMYGNIVHEYVTTCATRGTHPLTLNRCHKHMRQVLGKPNEPLKS